MLTHLFFQSPTFVLMSISFIRSEDTLCNVHCHYGLIRMLIERKRRISLNFIKDRVWKFHIDVAHLTQSHAFHLSIVKRQVLLFWACIVTFCKLLKFYYIFKILWMIFFQVVFWRTQYSGTLKCTAHFLFIWRKEISPSKRTDSKTQVAFHIIGHQE